jgi:predicted RNA binding protein YcfA (HicA-like mRNA interferase family)
VKRKELLRILKKDGWIITEGGKHLLATHPTKPGEIPIPRGTPINKYTAQGILKAAGIG